jgi:acyl carrier protein
MDVSADVTAYLKDEVLQAEAASMFEPDMPLLDGLVDSFGLMSLISFIEDRYDIVVEAEDITAEHFMTVAEIERFVVHKSSTG